MDTLFNLADSHHSLKILAQFCYLSIVDGYHFAHTYPLYDRFSTITAVLPFLINALMAFPSFSCHKELTGTLCTSCKKIQL
ncbi:hypothetical protein [Capnocytophaga endodontalis]|uniref:hypothetical protein n=1 Tax=Capnocytophaga endodontalis TaxID=2708117 RepID=UPI0012FCBCF4|nr:hypothetical protein [Capnocytophaga endodontalis]